MPEQEAETDKGSNLGRRQQHILYFSVVTVRYFALV